MADIAKKKRKLRKEKYVERLNQYLTEYRAILIIQVDNVGSNQLQKIRIALRGKASVLMGKNTLIRKVLRENIAKNPKLEALLPQIYSNIGFVFTNGSLNEIRKTITDFKVPAGARTGTLAPNEVLIPPGTTGLDPSQTSFFQALNIATKIVRGAIEIINPVILLKPGDKVSPSHVALLDKLSIRPFHYGAVVSHVYEDGVVYEAAILDISQDDLLKKFLSGVRSLALVSLGISYPTLASLPFIVSNAFSKLLAITLATEISFPQADKFKEALKNPAAFAPAPAAAAAAPAKADDKGKGKEKEKEKPKEESEEEGDFGLGGGLFD